MTICITIGAPRTWLETVPKVRVTPFFCKMKKVEKYIQVMSTDLEKNESLTQFSQSLGKRWSVLKGGNWSPLIDGFNFSYSMKWSPLFLCASSYKRQPQQVTNIGYACISRPKKKKKILQGHGAQSQQEAARCQLIPLLEKGMENMKAVSSAEASAEKMSLSQSDANNNWDRSRLSPLSVL